MTRLPSAQSLVQDSADLARTLGHPHRLSLLEHIAQGERAVESLAQLSGLSVANASQHLQHLKRAGLVQTRRDGKRVLYRLGDGPILPLLAALREFSEQQRRRVQAVVDDSVYQPDTLEAIDCDALLQRLQDGDVTLLDVRTEADYALGHLPGAINIPFEELAQRLAELPADRPVVAYCRGPHCLLSHDTVIALRARGLEALRLINGYPQWQAAGLTVETGPAVQSLT